MSRPSKYKPVMCEQLLSCMSEGLSRKAVAKELGINYQTFLNYIERHPEFAEAAAEGDNLAEVYWTTQFEKGATGENKGCNSAMMIFYMKNRFHWRDRIDQHVSHEQVPLLDDLDNDCEHGEC